MIGQINNGARHIKDSIYNHIKTSTVNKIGRKFFYVDGIKFEVSCGFIRAVSDYSSNYHIFLSKEDIELSKFNYEFKSLIRDFTSGYGGMKIEKISVNDKKIIAGILEKYKGDN